MRSGSSNSFYPFIKRKFDQIKKRKKFPGTISIRHNDDDDDEKKYNTKQTNFDHQTKMQCEIRQKIIEKSNRKFFFTLSSLLSLYLLHLNKWNFVFDSKKN